MMGSYVFAFLKRRDRGASKFKITDTDGKKMQIRIEQLKVAKTGISITEYF